VLNTCKVVNRKFDTGISYRIEVLSAEKRKGRDQGKRKKNTLSYVRSVRIDEQDDEYYDNDRHFHGRYRRYLEKQFCIPPRAALRGGDTEFRRRALSPGKAIDHFADYIPYKYTHTITPYNIIYLYI
jgi:hypothetical protein